MSDITVALNIGHHYVTRLDHQVQESSYVPVYTTCSVHVLLRKHLFYSDLNNDDKHTDLNACTQSDILL